jgi:hypothetical protein
MITFVTAFINLNEDRSKEKSAENRFELFIRLLRTGIRIHLFLSKCYARDLLLIDAALSANLTVEYIELEDLDTYKEIQDLNYTLPHSRNTHKDTSNYMILMNSKIEFMKRASNVIESLRYAWIDFSIFHVLKDPDTSTYLSELPALNIKEGLYIPGCWNKAEPNFSAISWRFCGGFFLGDKSSIEAFYDIHKNKFKEIIVSKGLSWEVNVWALYEYAYGLQCTWFKADHNDSIVKLPGDSILN